jgi:hypothetical protein
LFFCFVFLRLVYPMLPVSGMSILIAPSVFSNVYLISDGYDIYNWNYVESGVKH